MRIGIISSTRGDVDIVNNIADKENIDYLLSVGNFGIHYRSVTGKDKSNFYEYIEGAKKFNVPVVAVRGARDNIDLVNKLIIGKLKISNFTLLPNSSVIHIIDNIKSNITGGMFSVGGVGGSYSPKHYKKDKLFAGEKRHFIEREIHKLQENGQKEKSGISILLMHDLVGSGTKKDIIYSDATYRILADCRPLYCFVSKYNWWGASNLPGTTMVILPYANIGYAILDTKEWDVMGVSCGDTK